MTFAGKKTCYVYGADGKRLKKIDNLATTQDCATTPASAPATVYFGVVEIRGWKLATEQVITYPHPNVKLVNGRTPAEATYLHRDQLGSVRAITTPAAEVIEKAVYMPFGAQSEWLSPGQTAPETKGWIGERYDADAGLQYLNARYYDPVLGMFLQPDWFEVTMPGVGTNRYAYSFNDPINKMDRGGNLTYKDGAKLSEDVYDNDTDAPEGFRVIDGRGLKEMGLNPDQFVDEETGLKARLYQNTEPGEYTLASPELRAASPVLIGAKMEKSSQGHPSSTFKQ